MGLPCRKIDNVGRASGNADAEETQPQLVYINIYYRQLQNQYVDTYIHMHTLFAFALYIYIQYIYIYIFVLFFGRRGEWGGVQSHNTVTGFEHVFRGEGGCYVLNVVPDAVDIALYLHRELPAHPTVIRLMGLNLTSQRMAQPPSQHVPVSACILPESGCVSKSIAASSLLARPS